MKNKALVHYDAQDLRAIESSGRLDANESIHFARQLEFIKVQAYDVKRPMLSALALMPIDTSIPEGAESITYRQYDTVGMAKIISNYADDLPRADVTAKEFTSPVRSVGVSYGYSMQEVRASIFAGTNLDARKMRAARRAHEEKINTVAWAGDATSNLPGFLSNGNIPGYTVTADGTGTSKLWTTKTADQILRDMNGICRAVKVATKDVHQVNELWLPTGQYDIANTLPRSSNSDKTVLQAFKDSHPGITVKSVVELMLSSGGTLNQMVALENNADNFGIQVPMMFRQYAPQLKGLEYVIPCESRFGGVVIPYPLAFAIADSI